MRGGRRLFPVCGVIYSLNVEARATALLECWNLAGANELGISRDRSGGNAIKQETAMNDAILDHDLRALANGEDEDAATPDEAELDEDKLEEEDDDDEDEDEDEEIEDEDGLTEG